MQARGFILSDASGEARRMLGGLTDVTQRTQMEQQLREAQRLKAVGQLTGGVAHDFNNLLTVITGNAEVLAEDLRAQPQLAALADMVVQAGQRAADLIQRLLAFARRQPLAPVAVDVPRQLAELEPLLRRSLGENIRIEVALGESLPPVMIDPAQLDNALLNVCLNARDAMPQGGTLSIEAQQRTLDEAYCRLHAEVAPGHYVAISVSDTGTGIAPEDLPHVFEPFFSTKPDGKGTGLGLAMVYGFVKQSGGHVAIYSEPGLGTTVTVYLPVAAHAQAAARPEAGDGIEPAQGESVLVVEDNELVRVYAEQQLAALGYRVTVAASGAEALEVLRGPQPVDLLFTDVVMPGMSGPQLAVEARALRPGLPVLYASGYTQNAIVHHGRLDPGLHLVQKPYRRAELARRIRFALAAGEGGAE